jgi:hypothetical protein
MCKKNDKEMDRILDTARAGANAANFYKILYIVKRKQPKTHLSLNSSLTREE